MKKSYFVLVLFVIAVLLTGCIVDNTQPVSMYDARDKYPPECLVCHKDPVKECDTCHGEEGHPSRETAGNDHQTESNDPGFWMNPINPVSPWGLWWKP